MTMPAYQGCNCCLAGLILYPVRFSEPVFYPIFWESSDFGHPGEDPAVRTMCWKKVLLFLRVLK